MKNEVLTCVVCQGNIEHQKTPEGEVFWNSGHNADPVAEGRCCGKCNETQVKPTRFGWSILRDILRILDEGKEGA